MSRFLLSNMGSRGDIQIFTDLGRSLRGRGHTVVFATDALHREFVESRDLEYAELCSTTVEEQAHQMARLIHEPENDQKASIAAWEYLLPLTYQTHVAMKALSEREQFDGVIVSDSAMRYTAGQFESTTTMVIVHYIAPNDDSYYRDWSRYEFPQILAMSPTILQPPALDEWWLEVGFFAPARRSAPLPEEVEHFLAAGAPPVFITMGSMYVDGRHFGDIFADAIRTTGLRAIIQRGAARIQPSAVPPSVLMVEELPYDALFPRVSCVVLHGGVGTTAAVVRAGVPAIFLPYVFDQWNWGRRFESLGAGGVLAPKTLTAAQLASQLVRATTDPGVILAARELGAKVRAEGDGLSKACDAIEAQIREFSGRQRAWTRR